MSINVAGRLLLTFSARTYTQAGFIIGPMVLGQSKGFERLIYSMNTWEPLNTLSMMAFMFFLFMVGVKTDLNMVRKMGNKAVAVACVGTLLSFGLVMLAALLLRHMFPEPVRDYRLVLAFNFRWCLTSYTVLTCTLSELHLLTSKLGRLAMSASLMADFASLLVSCVLSAFLLGMEESVRFGVYMLVTVVGVMAFIGFVARPVALWIIRRTPEGSLLDGDSFVAILFIALLCGFLTEVMFKFVANIHTYIYMCLLINIYSSLTLLLITCIVSKLSNFSHALLICLNSSSSS